MTLTGYIKELQQLASKVKNPDKLDLVISYDGDGSCSELFNAVADLPVIGSWKSEREFITEQEMIENDNEVLLDAICLG